jgi:hypothetical protein
MVLPPASGLESHSLNNPPFQQCASHRPSGRQNRATISVAADSGQRERSGFPFKPERLFEFKPVSSGAEHEVFFDSKGQKAIKVTRGGAFGHSVVACPGQSATPGEYLARWLLHNSLFGDTAELLGVIPGEVMSAFVVSQKWITAHPEVPTPDQAEIDI